MEPLSSQSLRGNWACVLLPINADDSIDFARMADEVDALIAARVSGIYTNGTASEFFAQSEAEFDQVQQLVAGRCSAAGIPFQIGASHTSAQTTLERIGRAKALGPSAFQVVLPDWYPVLLEEALAFLSRAAETAHPIPLVLYNPPHAKTVLQPEDYAALTAALPALIGIKVVPDGDNWYARMKPNADRLSIFVPGTRLATGISQGARGAYSNVACLQPAGAQQWYELMQTDFPAALRLEARIQQFFGTYIFPFKTGGYPNHALDKLLATVGGWSQVGLRVRWPYRSIPEDEVEALRRIARQQLPELFP